MKPEEQNITIAESLGWREAFPADSDTHPEIKRGGIMLLFRWVNEITHERVFDLPNFHGSLDACAIAEKSLNAYQRHKYTILVRGTVASVDSMWAMVHATAAQKAEAYLRALNLWKE